MKVLGAAGVVACAVLLLATPAAAAGGKKPSCNIASPTGELNIALFDQGVQRPYTLFVPDRYKRKKAIPLIVNLHPSGGSGATELATADFEEVANRRGYAVAAPNGAVSQDGGYYWNVPGVPLVSGQPIPPGTPNDESYLLKVIRQSKKTVCIDPRRVYFAGYSGGARMASQMACDHATSMAAFSPVVGLRAGVPVETSPDVWQPDASTCKPKQPVSVLAFHGTDDTVNPYFGNDDPRWGYGVEQAIGAWGRYNRCKRGPETLTVSPTTDLIGFTKCKDSADVGLYRSTGGAHAWPGYPGSGTGAADTSINATELMFDFFANHRLPAKKRG